MRPVGQNSGFQQFSSPDEGMQAMQNDLMAKVSGNSKAMQARFGANYQPTLENIITTWAPPSENDTGAYIRNVSNASGLAPNAVLSPQDIGRIVPAMIKQEGGNTAVRVFTTPVSANVTQTNYSQLSDDELLKMAGIAAPAQVQPGFLQRLQGNVDNRRAQMETLATQAVAGDISYPEALARQGLKSAQLLGDTAGTIIGTAIPDFVKEGASNAVNYLATTDPGRAVVGAVTDFNQNHPIASGRIGSIYDAANVLLPFAKVRGKSLINTATETAGDVGNAALPVVQKAGNVALSGAGKLLPAVDEGLAPIAATARKFDIPLSFDQITSSRAAKNLQKVSQELPFSGQARF